MTSPKDATSAKVRKKSLIKFKKLSSTPLGEGELAKLKPEIAASQARMAEARAHAADMFEAYQNQDIGEFVQYLEAHPPSPVAIFLVIQLAESADDPDKPSKLGKLKWEKLYGKQKAGVLLAWSQYQTGKNLSKNHFVQMYAKSLAASGTTIPASTIYNWLPKKKK